jgi:hypothetical protein
VVLLKVVPVICEAVAAGRAVHTSKFFATVLPELAALPLVLLCEEAAAGLLPLDVAPADVEPAEQAATDAATAIKPTAVVTRWTRMAFSSAVRNV